MSASTRQDIGLLASFRFKEFIHSAASWSRVERTIARVEVGAQGADTRFVVT
ncbi:hypothetical protein X760_18215 [Mesorhizobium sp. LSHC422A00]|nr:hypothetical protein X762_31800 [Mesorhizobium sp. LSHC426A00]ESX45185.1 hypothetical protein X761_32750 [Mesorhizobium sp. LSHC424B00]ESX60161.1 hypothetical protein X760_18215 [Mesorhizobium sp. LSHC422A00]ESX63871.1 hypothetical protein X758_32725 [Mesorhizobium sp. LSHC416B00]